MPKRTVRVGLGHDRTKGSLHGSKKETSLNAGIVSSHFCNYFVQLRVSWEDFQRNVLLLLVVR